jgi:hypothetical protein
MWLLYTNRLTISQRHNEFVSKRSKAMKDVLGDRTERVIRLQILATAPAKQGHGYASSLVKVVTRIVSAGRTC